MRFAATLAVASLAGTALACADDGHSCYGPQDDVVLTRKVKRMQPESSNATSGPRAPLEWGQLNFLHTTDTHGWLEGHLKEQNYGADWGDYVSFTTAMKAQARELGVDLLLIDTGDLHDGAGLSDATDPNGLISNPIWENIDYDLLAIGNHELYVTEIAYEHFNQFAKVYGDRYVTSNVQIINPSTGAYEYIGSQYRYFTTEQGLRIMAFGVLFDFTGNSNVSKVIKAADLVQEAWFQDAVNHEGVDMFILLGHNAARPTDSTSTMGTVYSAIRTARPDLPIQIFGGHTHIRDFAVYDNKATGLESGRYCETLGWLSITGIEGQGNSTYAAKQPEGLPAPTRPAVSVNGTAANSTLPTSDTPSALRYSRRYLDWNRWTFGYHAVGSQSKPFDTQHGKAVTATITGAREQLNLSSVIGCAPQTWCIDCKPFGDPGNIYTLLKEAIATVLVNQSRADVPRIIFINTGSVRFDLVQGPFTYDDSFIVSPFTNTIRFIPDVPWESASQVLDIMNAGPYQKKKLRRSLTHADLAFTPLAPSLPDADACIDPPLSHSPLHARAFRGGRLLRRQEVTTTTPGYATSDDFGTDGDDTLHSPIPAYDLPIDVQANASFPADGSAPDTVDVVYLDFIEDYVIAALNEAGGGYDAGDAAAYMDESFTSNMYLPEYARVAWQDNVGDCPVGKGVGFDKRR
ncbi:calcineurin-like phosphoesterase [Diplodia corticola]|uniref:Calcineurin-like phosphoesterase n=1 Tax=Diplodia corticola TaxID=236234 RepID=A0A1J9RTZ9_9PEZI|nr:calcineurin-like phosphoesterase [Diplodia corticola]OJD31340.1 calcineurin-like phosphoesterase [Diplodia corticola]